MKELQMIMMAEVYEALSLCDMISAGTWPGYVDGQNAGSLL